MTSHLLTTLAAALALLSPLARPAPEPARVVQEPVGLDAVIERLDLVGIPLGDALRLLAEETGVNLVASEEAAAKSITTYLQEVTVRDAIETIAKSNGLWYRIDPQNQVVRLMSSREFERDLVLFRDQETRVFTLLYPNALELAVAIRNLFGNRVQFRIDDEGRFEDFDEISERFQRFDLLEQRAQSLGIFTGGQTNVVGGGGGSGINSFGSSNAFRRSNSSSFTQQAQRGNLDQQDIVDPGAIGSALSPEQLERLQESLAQGGVEGIDPALLAQLRGGQTSIYVSIVRRNNMIAVRSSDREALDEIAELVQRLDVATPQVLLELKVMTVDLSEDFQSVFDFAYLGDKDQVAFDAGTPNATDFIYQYVDSAFQARLRLLEQRGRVTTLATPLLLVANSEVARLFVGEERPLVRNVTSQTTVTDGVAVTSVTPTIEIRPVGTTILVTPNINADRTVTLRLIEETSLAKEDAADIPIQGSTAGGLQTFPVDVVAARTVNATVVGKDGLTLALGGLIEESIEQRRTGIPWLMDVPYLGVLFRREHDVRRRSELVVLIKPMVLFTATESLARGRAAVGAVSIHPSAGSLGASQLDTFAPHEVPRGAPDLERLKQALPFVSGRESGE